MWGLSVARKVQVVSGYWQLIHSLLDIVDMKALGAGARHEKKRVPLIIVSILRVVVR